MVTQVGTQDNFIEVVKGLVELDYDAVEAYEATINRMENRGYRFQFELFKQDHLTHIEELNTLLRKKGEKEVKGPSTKQWITKGKVLLSNLIGNDYSILRAMSSNENDTIEAYIQANKHKKKWTEAVQILEKALSDEKNHKRWIEDVFYPPKNKMDIC